MRDPNRAERNPERPDRNRSDRPTRRTPTIADQYADLLGVLSERQRRAITLRLTTGYYEGWHPSRSEIADLVAIELGLLTVERSMDRHRQRTRGHPPVDYIERVLARNPPPSG